MARGYWAETVEEYLAVVPVACGVALGAVRASLLEAIPEVGELISYRVPTFTYRGRKMLAISAAQNHCSLHLMSTAAAKVLRDELNEGTFSGATLQFAADAPLGPETIRLIVERRMAEIDGRL